MKKLNIITMSILVGIIVLITLFIIATGQNKLTLNPNDGAAKTESEETEFDTTESTEETQSTDATESTENTESTEVTESTENTGTGESDTPDTPVVPDTPDVPDTPNPGVSDTPITVTSSMDSALFIGDSRTVGIKEYSGLTEPDYFATVGMSLYDIYDERVDVDGVGNVSITELLTQKRYDKIYIMLGINEAWDSASAIADRLGNFIDLVHEKQPGTVVFIMANIHVSQSYQDKKPAFASENMNKMNSAMAAHANNQDVFYLDANFMFDDEVGNLDSNKTGDGAHLKAIYYKPWVEWIVEQTEQLLGN